MMSEKYRELIDSLIEKTNLGKSLWNKTSVQDQYKLILDGGMIVLSYGKYIFGKSIKLDLYNKSGEIIDSLSRDEGIVNPVSGDVCENNSDFELLNRLYQAILNLKEAKINEQLNMFMAEIKASDKIGKRD